MRSPAIRLDPRLLLALAAALTFALGAAACGDSGDDGGGGGDGGADVAGGDEGSERALARATVERLYDAMAEMDAEGVCAQLNDEAQRQIASGGLGSEGDSCADGIQGFFDEAEEAGGLQATLNAEVRRVEIDGDSATATVSFGPGRRGEVPLSKVDGEWKLEAAGAAPSAAP
jgi:hypothetical protein